VVLKSLPEIAILIQSQFLVHTRLRRGFAEIDPDVMTVPASALGRAVERSADERYEDEAIKRAKARLWWIKMSPGDPVVAL
jgi:hypothetical protein